MNNTERAERLDRFIATGTLIRHGWTDGNERACLLAALSPEAGKAEHWSACPADVMPPWLAAITPWMGLSGSDAAWPGMVKRYAAIAHRWHVLTPATWQRLLYEFCAITVREAMSHTTDERVLKACEEVAVICEHGAAGVAIDKELAERVLSAAMAAWEASDSRSAGAAVWAAAAVASVWAVEVADMVEVAAAWAAEAAAWAVSVLDRTAGDRITDKLLSAIERECARADS